jgi:PAS domain-containing protein
MDNSNRLLTYDGIVGHAARGDQSWAADSSQHLGWFRFYFDDDRWKWSPQVERMHGYRPGTTAPSTLLVLSHVHLDDFHEVAAVLQDARYTHHPFSSRHRILDTGHHLHYLVMIGAPFFDREGAAAGMQGFCIDVTAVSLAASRNGDSHSQTMSDAEGGRRQVRAATQC